MNLKSWRTRFGALFLLLQLVGVIYARFTPCRYFCWAPYDEITKYRVEVIRNGHQLTEAESRRRYGLPQSSRDNRSWAHPLRVIKLYETTLGARDDASVTVTYSVNGGPEQVWHWTKPEER